MSIAWHLDSEFKFSSEFKKYFFSVKSIFSKKNLNSHLHVCIFLPLVSCNNRVVISRRVHVTISISYGCYICSPIYVVRRCFDGVVRIAQATVFRVLNVRFALCSGGCGGDQRRGLVRQVVILKRQILFILSYLFKVIETSKQFYLLQTIYL